jgi:hypothetical protein
MAVYRGFIVKYRAVSAFRDDADDDDEANRKS